MFATSTDPKAAAESVDGDIIANNAASLDGKLRTLVVGVADERGDELLAHRNRDPGVLFRHQRWVDAYKLPGQYITITDVDSGKQITKPISVSPYHARSTAPNSDVSVIEILLDSGSDDGDENFFAAAQPPARLKVSPVRGGGFENPLFPEYNLKRAIEHGHSIVCIAGGTRGVGPLRSVMNWPDISSHAGTHPVTLFYLHAGDMETAGQSAAYVQVWDNWREAGAKVVPCYGEFFDDGVFQMQAAIAGSANGGGKFETVLGKDPSKVTVLMAGVSGEESKAVLNIFSTLQKVPKEQILIVSEFALKKGKCLRRPPKESAASETEDPNGTGPRVCRPIQPGDSLSYIELRHEIATSAPLCFPQTASSFLPRLRPCPACAPRGAGSAQGCSASPAPPGETRTSPSCSDRYFPRNGRYKDRTAAWSA